MGSVRRALCQPNRRARTVAVTVAPDAHITEAGTDAGRMLESILQTIVSGIVGFAGGAGALWAQQHFAWKPQKRVELRNKVFDEAMNALASYETEALDARLQDDWENGHLPAGQQGQPANAS
jgi:hypothetical protein